MNEKRVLIVASLVSLLFMTIHIAQDTVLQAEGSMKYPIPMIIFAVWLYGTLLLSDRVWGYVIMLLGGFFSVGMIVIHAKGIVVRQTGGLFFIWTMFAMTATGWLTILLAARAIGSAVRARRTKAAIG